MINNLNEERGKNYMLHYDEQGVAAKSGQLLTNPCQKQKNLETKKTNYYDRYLNGFEFSQTINHKQIIHYQEYLVWAQAHHVARWMRTVGCGKWSNQCTPSFWNREFSLVYKGGLYLYRIKEIRIPFDKKTKPVLKSKSIKSKESTPKNQAPDFSDSTGERVLSILT